MNENSRTLHVVLLSVFAATLVILVVKAGSPLSPLAPGVQMPTRPVVQKRETPAVDSSAPREATAADATAPEPTPAEGSTAAAAAAAAPDAAAPVGAAPVESAPVETAPAAATATEGEVSR